MSIIFEPVGIIHSPIKDARDAPRFFTISDIKGTIEIYPEYAEGLKFIEREESIIVLFHFHLSKGYELIQRKCTTGELKGVFTLCSPKRPNPIGMSVLRLEKVEGNILYVAILDMVDGTPVLDIKPYRHFKGGDIDEPHSHEIL
jgi:tRNA-Thr(GGU) m(6)t(6)A37 methyltransferase TsaA